MIEKGAPKATTIDDSGPPDPPNVTKPSNLPHGESNELPSVFAEEKENEGLNQSDHETQDEDEDIEFQDCAEEDEVVQEVSAEPQPTMTLAQQLHKTITEANITVDKDHLYHLSYFLKIGEDQFLDKEKLNDILLSFLKELQRNGSTTNLAEMHKEFTFIFEDYNKC